MKRFARPLALLLALAFIGASVLTLYLPYEYASTLPREPVPNAGRIISLNNHGVIVYLTNAESRMLALTLYAQFVFGIGASLLFVLERRL
jgi:hypothetical protein